MSTSIPNIYIQTFERNLRHLAQQEIARLRPYVTERGTNGQNHNWERVNSKEASIKVSRAQPTPIADFDFSRRTSIAKTYDIGEFVETEDQVQAAVQLNSNLVQGMGYAMRRAYDDEIIEAAIGDSLDGQGSAVPFTTAQTVGDGSETISFDFVTQVQEKYLENDIPTDMAKVMVVGPAQVRRLMQLTEQTSGDYVRSESLQKLDQLTTTGICPMWMGFTWIMSTRLQQPSSGVTDCFSFTRRGIGLQINKDICGHIAQDPSRSFGWSLYSYSVFGACRVEDEHVVKLSVADVAA